MDYRTDGGPRCARCGVASALEQLEVRADGHVCRVCCARESVAQIDATVAAARQAHQPVPRDVPTRAQVKAAERYLLPMALLPLLAWGACAAEVVDADVGIFAWMAACVVALVAIVLGIKHRSHLAILLGLLSPVVTFFLGFFVAPGFSYSRGRALRRAGAPRIPQSSSTDAWLIEIGEVPGAPPEVATGWRINAATETASVAAFSHLATELLALGAPADLVARAHEDALDEIRHARLCYALARRVDGESMGPAPFPPARLPRDGAVSLASLAADCVVEACLYEQASARVAESLLQRPDLPAAVRSVLETIAVDEARHAQHGREIVAWCIGAGGERVLDACRRALRAIDPAHEVSPFADDTLEPFGLAGIALWRRSVAEALRDVTQLVDRRLSDVAARAA